MKPVVALHGAGGGPRDWDALAANLPAPWQLIPLTLTGPWGWESVLDRLHADLERLGLDNPPIVGASLGGMVAALWGRRHPQCPAVIDLDGHGVPTQAVRYRPEERDQLHDHLTALRDQFTRFGQPELQQAMESVDWLKVFADIECRMLIVAATKPLPGNDLFDAYLRGLRPDLDALAATRTDIEVVWHPSTHAMIAEDPKGIADLVVDFLELRVP